MMIWREKGGIGDSRMETLREPPKKSSALAGFCSSRAVRYVGLYCRPKCLRTASLSLKALISTTTGPGISRSPASHLRTVRPPLTLTSAAKPLALRPRAWRCFFSSSGVMGKALSPLRHQHSLHYLLFWWAPLPYHTRRVGPMNQPVNHQSRIFKIVVFCAIQGYHARATPAGFPRSGGDWFGIAVCYALSRSILSVILQNIRLIKPQTPVSNAGQNRTLGSQSAICGNMTTNANPNICSKTNGMAAQ